MSVLTDLRPSVESTEKDLFSALAVADPAERVRLQELLVQRYTWIVRTTAARYANPAVDIEDLLQVGYVGLVLAISRFDPEHGADFVAYAKPTVAGEVRRYFRDKRRWIRMPRRLQEVKAVLRVATDELTHDLRRAPTVTELATKLAVNEELVLEALTADDCFSPASLDTPMGGDGQDTWTLSDTLGEQDERLDLLVDRQAVRPLLMALGERDQQIIHMRFFEDLTQAQIGERLGLSQMHISRLLAKALAKLREGLEGE